LGSVSSYTLNPKQGEGWDGRKREGRGGAGERRQYKGTLNPKSLNEFKGA
jgi:hypothetical protein